MKLIREHINEKFQENSDPIKDMNIGVVQYLKHGIQQLQKEPGVGAILYISRYDNFEHMTVDYYGGNSLEIEYLVNKHIGKDFFKLSGTRQHALHIIFTGIFKPKYVEAFKKVFNMLEHVNEKFTEDSDPVNDLGIGLVNKISKAIKSITQDKLQFLGTNIINEIDISDKSRKLICYTSFSLPSHAPYIKELFTRYGLADYLIFNEENDEEKAQHYYWFTLKIKPQYRKFFKKALSEKKINEKFEEDSDPIEDMGISGFEEFKQTFGSFISISFEGFWSSLSGILIKGNSIIINVFNEPYKDSFGYNWKNALEQSGFNKFVKNGHAIKKGIMSASYEYELHPKYKYILDKIDKFQYTKKIHSDRNFKGRNPFTYEADIKWKFDKPVNEKFEEDTDPIADLGIGGFNLSEQIYNMIGKFKLMNIYDMKDKPEVIEYWQNTLENALLDKEVTGIFSKGNENSWSAFRILTTPKVKRIELFVDDPLTLDNMAVLDFALVVDDPGAWVRYPARKDYNANDIKRFDETWYYYSFGDMSNLKGYTPKQKYTLYLK